MTDTTASADGGALPSENRVIHPDGQIVLRAAVFDPESAEWARDGWFLTGEFV